MVTLLALSCGAASVSSGLRPSRPWNPELADVFDDGFDYVAPLRTILGTPWFDEYATRLERRVAEADVVAVVKLRTIVPAAGGGQPFGGVEVVVVEPLFGSVAPGDRLRLDFATGSRTEERLASERARIESMDCFVAYLRLYDDGLGAIRSHWHLSPHDEDLVQTIRRALAGALSAESGAER